MLIKQTLKRYSTNTFMGFSTPHTHPLCSLSLSLSLYFDVSKYYSVFNTILRLSFSPFLSVCISLCPSKIHFKCIVNCIGSLTLAFGLHCFHFNIKLNVFVHFRSNFHLYIYRVCVDGLCVHNKNGYAKIITHGMSENRFI